MKVLLAAALLVFCLACGGGGGGGTTATIPPVVAQDPEGIYLGTVGSLLQQTRINAYAVATPAGEFRYAAANDYLAEATLSTNSGLLYFGPSGQESSGITLTGVSVLDGVYIQGNYALATGDSGSFVFDFDSLYTRVQPLSSFAGTYTSTVSSNSIQSTVTLDTAGNISGTYTGTLVQLDPTKNLYRVVMSASGDNYSGLAFWADAASGLTANSFYVQVTGSNNTLAYGAVFTKN